MVVFFFSLSILVILPGPEFQLVTSGKINRQLHDLRQPFGFCTLIKIFDLTLQSKPVWMCLKVGRFSAECCSVWKSKSLQSQTQIALPDKEALKKSVFKLQWHQNIRRIRHKLLRQELLVLIVSSDSAESDRFSHRLFH